MFTIKPLDVQAVIDACRLTRGIVTVEEHSMLGGLGEAVAHAVVTSGNPVPMKIMGLPEEVMIGKSAELFQYYGISAEGICESAKKLIGG